MWKITFWLQLVDSSKSCQTAGNWTELSLKIGVVMNQPNEQRPSAVPSDGEVRQPQRLRTFDQQGHGAYPPPPGHGGAPRYGAPYGAGHGGAPGHSHPYAGGPGYGPPSPQPVVPGHGLSIASMVLGIVSIPMFWLYGIIGLLALVFGCIGFSTSKRATGKGSGYALTGIVTGAISLLMMVGLIALFGYAVYTGAKDTSNLTAGMVSKYAAAESHVELIGVLVYEYEVEHQRLPNTLAELRQGVVRYFPERDPWGREYELYLWEGGFTVLSEGASLADDDDVYYNSDIGEVMLPDVLPRSNP